MKKFIAAFDGLNFSESTMSYGIFLAKHSNAHLVGVFLEDFTRHSYSVADITKYEGESFDKHVQELNERDREERDECIEQFEQACQSAGLNYSVHRDRNVAIQELLHESIYCDLLIVGGRETLTRYEEQAPTRFIRELLNDVQCPVVIVPPQYRPIGKFSLLYDGGPSSVYAVKMFSYMFGIFQHIEVEVITVKEPDQNLHLPQKRLIKEFMVRHFPAAEYVIVKGFAEDEIVKYLQREKKDVMVVLGAYRRSKLSRVFKPSMADVLMQYVSLPLFIAHNKS